MKNKINNSKNRCTYFRRKIIDISQKVPALHIGGAFSSTEIVDLIYNDLMTKKSEQIFQDTFIMSKGHSCIMQYVVLNYLGIISDKQIDEYCKPGGILGAHPDYGNPGIEASTGSLGHGMALAVGMHTADKINNQERKIFIVLSDGELQEGSTWEALMMAANLNCENLICFLDHNGSQSFGVTKEVHPKFYPIKSKLDSFGWETLEADGHDQDDIIKKYNSRKTKKPLIIICNTTKGKGVSYMENKPIWHYRSPNEEEYKIAMKELKI